MIEKLTPKDTVHNFCHTCVCSRMDDEVDNCQGDKAYAGPCAFYPYRNGDKRISVKVFRAFCMDCQGDSYQAIEKCNVEQCLVYPYRFGKNPAMIGRMDTRSRGLGGRLVKKEALL
jgi:hypothetical protein